MLAPWLKFLWESYKQCLDLLKNNNRVEKIYQEVAQMGFRFCRQYNRRPEFRKLCDTIRTHYTQCQRYGQQANGINLQLPETQALYLETRLVQLDTAIDMELWQVRSFFTRMICHVNIRFCCFLFSGSIQSH